MLPSLPRQVGGGWKGETALINPLSSTAGKIMRLILTKYHKAEGVEQLRPEICDLTIVPLNALQASPLLRKLLDGQAPLTKAHSALLFEAIRSAFINPDTCAEPTLRREYMKLVASIASRPDLFGRPERAHLDIYRIVGHIQNEMSTDDNFQFNKVRMWGDMPMSASSCSHSSCAVVSLVLFSLIVIKS